MEDSRSRAFLASIENVNIERVRPKQPATADDLSEYLWHRPQLTLEERQRVTERRRDELLQTLYQEGLNTDEVEGLVKEWIVLVTERDRLFREQLDQENTQDQPSETNDGKYSYLRDLRHLLRAHPPFAENSEEVNIRDALLTLEAHVTTYCSRHNIASPGNFPPTSKIEHSGNQVDGQDADAVTPKPAQPVALDHQTGQSRISQPPAVVNQSQGLQSALRPTTPHPPLPAKPQNLKEKLIKSSPQRLSAINKVSTAVSPSKKPPSGNKAQTTKPLNDVSNDPPTCSEASKTSGPPGETIKSSQSTRPLRMVLEDSPLSSTKSTFDPTSGHHATEECDGVAGTTSPAPPPLPSHLTPHKAVGTVQFIGVKQDTPSIQVNNEGEPLCNDLTNEPQDPSLELPTSEERSLLMNEISSVGQTILRRTNRDRSPGGTPIRANKNRLTLTGNTDMLQRALISKFRSFHSTPIKGDKRDSIDVSNAWSDVNGSLQVFDDPDITSTSGAGLSDVSSGLKLDPNLSSAV